MAMNGIIRSHNVHLLFTAAFAFCLALPAASQVVELKDIKPTCPAPYFKEPVNNKCNGDNIQLKDYQPEAACVATLGLKFENNKCTFAEAAPAPNCGTLLPDLAYRNGSCVIDRSVPRSASGDYEGDYFHIIAETLPNSRIPYSQNTWIRVLSQRKLGEQDTELTVIAVSDFAFLTFPFDREIAKGARTVRASDLVETGATRVGWVYGALALPFKYYTGDKRFTTNVSIGPYVGWRWGRPGSAVTLAAAAAIGSVTGEVRDANDNVVGTPQLTSFSWAGGLMWDISKSSHAKPFKIGVFTGQDRVSNDNVVKFKNDGKWWFALQIGFEFTDN